MRRALDDPTPEQRLDDLLEALDAAYTLGTDKQVRKMQKRIRELFTELTQPKKKRPATGSAVSVKPGNPE